MHVGNFQESSAKMARRRPLHTCAATCIGIAHKACKRLQDVDGPVGTTTKRAIAFSNSFFPLIHTMLYHILAMLSIIDDQILTVEARIETILPRSTYFFDKIDALVCSAEALPHLLDNVFTKIPSMMHHFPLLDWTLLHLISCLNFLVSFLTHLGSKNTGEKEIRIDVNCKAEKNDEGTRNRGESSKGLPKGVVHLSVKRFHSWKSRMKALEEPLYAGDSPMYSCYQSENSSPVSDSSPDGTHMNCTYKEMLERGTKEDEQMEEGQSRKGS